MATATVITSHARTIGTTTDAVMIIDAMTTTIAAGVIGAAMTAVDAVEVDHRAPTVLVTAATDVTTTTAGLHHPHKRRKPRSTLITHDNHRRMMRR